MGCDGMGWDGVGLGVGRVWAGCGHGVHQIIFHPVAHSVHSFPIVFSSLCNVNDGVLAR